MKKAYTIIAIFLWLIAHTTSAQNMYRNYYSANVSSPESTLSIVHSNGFIYDFQTGKNILSVSQIYPDNMHQTGNNVYFLFDITQTPVPKFMLQGGFENFSGNIVLYGYDENYNHCPAFGIIDPIMQSFKYYILNDVTNYNVSFMDGCCGLDYNGSDMDYLFIRNDGKICAIQESNPFSVINIIPNTIDANRYTDISWDSYHNLFIACGSNWDGFGYSTIPFVDVFTFDFAQAVAMGFPTGVTHQAFYFLNPNFNNHAPEGKALHAIIDYDHLILYHDLGQNNYDIVWLTLIENYWNSSHINIASRLFKIPASKITAFDLLYDRVNNRLNFLGAMRYICEEYTCFLAQINPYTLTGIKAGQLNGGFAISPPCSIPFWINNIYTTQNIYGSHLKMQKMAWNYQMPYSSVLISGIGNDNGTQKNILTETYDIALSLCDYPLNIIENTWISSTSNPNPSELTELDYAIQRSANKLQDYISEYSTCDDPNAYSHFFKNDYKNNTLAEVKQNVDILFVDKRQFICQDFIGNIQYSLYATDGRNILNGYTSNGDVNNIPFPLRGIYILKAEDDWGNQAVKKVVLL